MRPIDADEVVNDFKWLARVSPENAEHYRELIERINAQPTVDGASGMSELMQCPYCGERLHRRYDVVDGMPFCLEHGILTEVEIVPDGEPVDVLGDDDV